jgi:hypothetical protein
MATGSRLFLALCPSFPWGADGRETLVCFFDRLQTWKVHFILSNTVMQAVRNAQLLPCSSCVSQAWILVFERDATLQSHYWQ